MDERDLEVTKDNMYNWLMLMYEIFDEEYDFYEDLAALVKKYNKEEFDLEINPLNRD